MNCEKCGKPVPKNLDYCPTCKINEANSVVEPKQDKQTSASLEENQAITDKTENNHISKNISSLILYPIFALSSILFYILGICGRRLYFYLSYKILKPEQAVNGTAMDMFSKGCAVILAFTSIVCAIEFSRRIATATLVKGMIFSLIIYILAPFVYRTSGGGFIDFGPVLDMCVLCVLFWVQPGVFFIVAFINKKIDKFKNQRKI